jgi:uncharacterized membrane protein YhhN
MKNKINTIYIIGKMAASSGFIAAALLNHGGGTGGGDFALLIAALAFCWLGDLFLALSDEINNLKKNPQFTMGVGSFTVAQILFCWELLRLIDGQLKPTIALALIMPLVVTTLVKKQVFDCGKDTVPSVIYSVLIGGFCGLGLNYLWVCGLNGQTALMGLGACLFFLSDLTLSFRCYARYTPGWITPLVLILYYAATYMIAFFIN